MRLVFAAAFLASCLAACGGQSAQQLTATTSTPPPASSSQLAVYSATLAVSSTCAARFPAELAVRHYDAVLSSSGQLSWSGPTVIQPPGRGYAADHHFTLVRR